MNRLSKADIKYYSSLMNKKFRQAEQLFVLEGKRLVSEILESSFAVEKFIVTDSFAEQNADFLKNLSPKSDNIFLCGSRDFSRFADTRTPQGIAAVAKLPENQNPDFFNSDTIVALTGISDPGNMGTILRTCNWFGFNDIITDPNCVDVFNPKVVRSSMGALFFARVAGVSSLAAELAKKQKSGYKLVTADTRGISIADYKFEGKNILLFASEAHGPSDELTGLSDVIISIPGKGNVESLNVASAAAIILSRISVQ